MTFGTSARDTSGSPSRQPAAPLGASRPAAIHVVEEMFDYAAAAQQELIAQLLHPEAIIVPLFHPERVVGPAEFPDFVREQLDWARYREAHAHDIVEAEPGRFLVAGCVRWSSRAGGFIDTTAFWAVVVRDGLIYRLKGCHRQEDAQASLDADDWSPKPQ